MLDKMLPCILPKKASLTPALGGQNTSSLDSQSLLVKEGDWYAPACVIYSEVTSDTQRVPACLSQTDLFPRPKSYMHPPTETRQDETGVVLPHHTSPSAYSTPKQSWQVRPARPPHLRLHMPQPVKPLLSWAPARRWQVLTILGLPPARGA